VLPVVSDSGSPKRQAELPVDDGPAFTPEQQARFDREIVELTGRFPADRKQAALLPALWLVQSMLGYLTVGALRQVARKLEISPEKTAEVATFYSMFRLQPAGRIRIDVCTNLSCSLCGAEDLLRRLEGRLDIGPGGTTADGKFTLREVECLASCGTAPVLQVNDEFHERVTPQALDTLLESLR
jgi:NADH-quinone oxidoreductase subunit E